MVGLIGQRWAKIAEFRVFDLSTMLVAWGEWNCIKESFFPHFLISHTNALHVDWKTHGSEYYECSRYKENPSVAQEANHVKARRALEKYLHYYGSFLLLSFFFFPLLVLVFVVVVFFVMSQNFFVIIFFSGGIKRSSMKSYFLFWSGEHILYNIRWMQDFLTSFFTEFFRFI